MHRYSSGFLDNIFRPLTAFFRQNIFATKTRSALSSLRSPLASDPSGSACAPEGVMEQWNMGILIVLDTFDADMKWHPHIHLIVISGGLSLEGKRRIETDPQFLMAHGGLKKQWKYPVTTRMERVHREGRWCFLSEP
jgi:hypothetical protein